MKFSKTKFSFSSFIQSIKTLSKLDFPSSYILSLYGPILIVLLIVALQEAAPPRRLTQDPLSIAKLPFYFGIVSNIGILLWCAAAAICFFTAFILRQAQASQKFSKFLFWSGMLTTLLMVDDLFMLHESAFPRLLGVSEKVGIVIYGIAALLYFVTYRRTILKTNWLVLGLSLSWLALSVLLDSVDIFKQVLGTERQYLAEDGAKFFGIATWMIYYSYICWQVFKQHFVLKQSNITEKVLVPLD